MNDEARRESQAATRKSSWLFTAVCCAYLLLGGWAAWEIFPIGLGLVAGPRFGVSSGALTFHLLLNYGWLIVAGVAILVTLTPAKQVVNLSERYRRPVNLVLLIAAIGFAPRLLDAFALRLPGPFHFIGK